MRPITDTLRDIRKGVVVDEATIQLREVVRAVDATHKPGKLIIELTVAPEKGGGNQKTITAKITSKVPAPDMPHGIFFSDTEGDLHRTDPEQREMFGDAVTPRPAVAPAAN